MNLFSRIKKMFGLQETSRVLAKRETLEPGNDYITRQVVIDCNGVHEVYYHNRCTDYVIGDVLPETIKKELKELVR